MKMPFLLPLLILVVFQLSYSTAIGTMPITVDIRNEVHGLFFRCQSGDHDFGNRSLPAQGEYSWTFRPSGIKATLYFCHFWWGGRDQVFDVFSRHIDCYPKLVCNWLVREDGFFFSRYHLAPYAPQWEKKYDWR